MTVQTDAGHISISTQRSILIVVGLVEISWLFFLSWMAVKA